MPLGVRIAQFDSLAVDLPLIFTDPLRNAWRFAVLCLLLLPPFFCCGLATGLILTAQARRAGRFYAASLAGAGLGGLLGLAFVSSIDPPRLSAATGTVAFVAALCLLLPSSRWRTIRSPSSMSFVSNEPFSSRRFPFFAGAAACYLASVWIFPIELYPSQFKPLRRTLDLPNAKVIASRPSVHGWIQIVDAPALRPAPAVSFDFVGEIPAHPAVFLNGLGYGSLLSIESARAPEWLDFTTDAAAFATTSTPRNVLLLENGPGGWAALAASHGASRVTVTEPNRALVDLLTRGETPLAPEWRLRPIHVVQASGRAFLNSTSETFDVIRFPAVGALGGTAGLGSTSEQFLLTREAFSDAWNRLTPDGMIAVTAWMDFPERNPLRLLATLVETAVNAGISPRAHLAAVRGWATVTFLLRRDPWTAQDTERLRRFCEEHSFDPLLLSDLRPEEREVYHTWQNPDFFRMVDQLVNGSREAIYRDYPFSLQPATDDRPYFSQFLRWTAQDRIAASFGSQSMPFFELGSITVALTFSILCILGVGGIVVPLARLGWRTPGKARLLLYFGGLGAGFMFVEIGLMLSAQAWLGSPVLAAAIVLTALLIASGSGSLWSEKFSPGAYEQKRTLIIIGLTIVIVAILLSALAPFARTWALTARLALLLGLVAPLGVVMGMAFPLGVRRLEFAAPAQIPWAWAINGCISVITPAGAMLLAMTAGFTSLFVAAASAYALALVSVMTAKRKDARTD
jgi:hypothetical protein